MHCAIYRLKQFGYNVVQIKMKSSLMTNLAEIKDEVVSLTNAVSLWGELVEGSVDTDSWKPRALSINRTGIYSDDMVCSC